MSDAMTIIPVDEFDAWFLEGLQRLNSIRNEYTSQRAPVKICHAQCECVASARLTAAEWIDRSLGYLHRFATTINRLQTRGRRVAMLCARILLDGLLKFLRLLDKWARWIHSLTDNDTFRYLVGFAFSVTYRVFALAAMLQGGGMPLDFDVDLVLPTLKTSVTEPEGTDTQVQIPCGLLLGPLPLDMPGSHI